MAQLLNNSWSSIENHKVELCAFSYDNNLGDVITIHMTIDSAVISGTKPLREFTLGPLTESLSVPGGRQLV